MNQILPIRNKLLVPILTFVLTVGVAGLSNCRAQFSPTLPQPPFTPDFSQVPPDHPLFLPSGGYVGGGFSSTLAEGAQRGFADIVRSRGMAAENFSRAAINIEEARRRFLENQLQRTRAYWARKQLGEAEIAADFARQREIRERWLAQRESGVPARLSPSQLDPYTGQIDWPSALRDEYYAPYRARLEELFAVRATTRSSYDVAQAIYDMARELREVLRDNVRGMQPNDYIAARRFLESLAYEGQRFLS